MTTTKLSRLQKQILVRALETHKGYTWGGKDPNRRPVQAEYKHLLPRQPTRSESAARSRAVRRLEERGLLRRLTWAHSLPEKEWARGYTYKVELTEKGAEMAERLRAVNG